MKNMGSKSTEWLASVGTHSLRDVGNIGVVKSYLRVKAVYPDKASLNLLYGLQAALLDLQRNEPPPDIKTELKSQV
jgi:hypothetical protein